MKDVVIGCITNYQFDSIKYWANSLDRCGFDGIKIVVCYNIPYSVADELIKRNYTILSFKKDDENQRFHYSDSPFNICLERFFHMWYFLKNVENKNEFRYLISTDVKDVIFQKNPSEWLEKNLGNHLINASSESIKYKDEEWGDNNLKLSFGDIIHSSLKDNIVYNAGIISGEYNTLVDLFLTIYLTCGGSPRFVPGGGGPDQAALNVLLSTDPYKRITRFTNSEDGWAAQLGTTGPQIQNKYSHKVVETCPIMKDGMVCTSDGIPFTIVHQYDRFAEWKKILESKYE